MKLVRSFLAANLIFSLVFVSFLTLAVSNTQAQQANIALQRGYRTGYSDGYMEGYRDVIGNSSKNFERHDEYSKANRAFNNDYGSLGDYRDGYQQGFQSGYTDGFDKQSFDAALPGDLSLKGIRTVSAPAPAENAIIEPMDDPIDDPIETAEVRDDPADYPAQASPTGNTGDVTYQARVADNVSDSTAAYSSPPPVADAPINYVDTGDIIVIPANTELVVELLDSISTRTSRDGDKFRAKIISPSQLNGAVIEGHVDKSRRPGKIKRRAELLLSFDRIILTQNRWSNFNAIVTDVFPGKDDNVKRVDIEGTVEGDRPYKDDLTKLGAATGSGAIIGGIFGGPVGVAVGAGVGAAFGVGAIVVDRGEHINLRPNQQIRIKSSYDTQIR